jgi:uncharacterized membrane-anchored protein
MTNALSHSDSLFAKLSKYRAKLLIFLAALQALLLIGIAGSHYNILWNGTEIRIATVPVDPRDLLYGDYVNLRYEISHLQPELWKDDATKPKRGDAVYVVLRSTGADGTMQAVAAYGHQPAAAAGETMIKGRITSSFNNEIWADYGLEKYYVPENTGKVLEDQAAHLIVHVKVASNGKAVIASLESKK